MPKVPLGDKPGVGNWTERYNALGGKGNWIRRVAEHLKGKGKTDGHAIAIAVNAARYLCKTGDVKLSGKQDVNPGSRAEACAAVARWDAALARARAKRTTDLTARRLHEIDLTAKRLKNVVDLIASD